MKKRSLKNCGLYVVIDAGTAGAKNPVRIARDAATGGADIIQFRTEPGFPARKILRTAIAMKNAVKKAGAIFIVNDRADIARASCADGVHLGQDDLPIESARRMLKPGGIIGISTHSLSQAEKAQARGADYISVGPIFRTPTKPGYAPVGLRLLKKAAGRVKIPVFAIGGINLNNIEKVIRNGAKRVVVVRAVVSAADVKKAAGRLKALL